MRNTVALDLRLYLRPVKPSGMSEFFVSVNIFHIFNNNNNNNNHTWNITHNTESTAV